MEFQSILGMKKPDPVKPEDIIMPGFFYDLNLDQVVKNIMDQQKLYDLRRFYYMKAASEDIDYRYEVMKDMDQDGVFRSVVDFSIGMRKLKEYIDNSREVEKAEQRQKWKLDAAFQYITIVLKLYEELKKEKLQSRGFQSFLGWLENYINTAAFHGLRNDTEQLISRFNEMKYSIQIKRDRIIIKQEYIEEDYCKQLQDIFREQSEVEHYYQSNPFGTIQLSNLEEAILKVLKKQYTEVFSQLNAYDKKTNDFIDGVLADFELESQFYVTFRKYRDEMQEMDFHFCYPKLVEDKFLITDGYDLALARKNAAVKKQVVFNDCRYEEGEHFLVITGPNQGGKTTYARALGQILYFAMIGLMVPAKTAAIPVFDCIYTHFATEESVETGAGKLKEELLRLKVLMKQVTKHSFVIFNEVFTSATSYDAYIMGKRVLDYFIEKDCIGIYVTHIHELTKEDDRIVSMVASLLSEDSNIRTFKIHRKPADGRSYANTIVDKYHMTYEEIKERLTNESLSIAGK